MVVLYEDGCGVHCAYIIKAVDPREALLKRGWDKKNVNDFLMRPDPDDSWNFIGDKQSGSRFRYGDEAVSFATAPKELPGGVLIVVETASDQNYIAYNLPTSKQRVIDRALADPTWKETRKRYVCRNRGQLNPSTAWEKFRVLVFDPSGKQIEDVETFEVKFAW